MTQEQIIEKINQYKNDMFGFISSDLIEFLSFDNARKYLKDEYVKKVEKGEEKWEQKPATKEQAIKDMVEYMEFAWGKANNCRGLSAGRSIEHMRASLLIAEDIELFDKLSDYSYYGKPQLRAICEKYNIEWKKYDDGKWRVRENGNFKKPEDIPKQLLLN